MFKNVPFPFPEDKETLGVPWIMSHQVYHPRVLPKLLTCRVSKRNESRFVVGFTKCDEQFTVRRIYPYLLRTGETTKYPVVL